MADHSLVTVFIAGLSHPWTMSVMEDGPEEGESEERFAEAQCEAARKLVENDHVPLYGVWGTYREHARGADTMVVFPEGTRVLAVFKSIA